MQTLKRIALALVSLIALAAGLLYALGWPVTRHASERASLGRASSAAAMEAVLDVPGPIAVETVMGADWSVDRSGVIDLEDPQAAGLEDGLEPIQLYLHVLTHPSAGRFAIDSGAERALFEAPERAALSGWVASAAGIDRMREGTSTADHLDAHPGAFAGVLLTHLHLDHVAGLRDFSAEVPIYAGPGETAGREAMAILTQPILDAALAGHGPIREWTFEPDPSGTFAGVIDVLGDETLFAIWVPGHTRGSVAFVARTPAGPVLFTGDVCHTAWGWEHDVAPGTFTADHAENARSLRALRALAARHPSMAVRLGHQSLD